MGGLDGLGDPRHHQRVKVQTAEVDQPVHVAHLEPGTGAAYHRHVEGPGAQVVDHHQVIGADGVPEYGGEVAGRRDRLRHQPRARQSRLDRRLRQHVTTYRSPAGRIGHRDGGWEQAGGSARLVGHPA
jgi:hypothetical protein